MTSNETAWDAVGTLNDEELGVYKSVISSGRQSSWDESSMVIWKVYINMLQPCNAMHFIAYTSIPPIFVIIREYARITILLVQESK